MSLLSKYAPGAEAGDVELTPEQEIGFLLAKPRMPRMNKDMGTGTHKLGPCQCKGCTACKARRA